MEVNNLLHLKRISTKTNVGEKEQTRFEDETSQIGFVKRPRGPIAEKQRPCLPLIVIKTVSSIPLGRLNHPSRVERRAIV